MPVNYCPFCGRFMQMLEFEHACDRVNILRGVHEWCNTCGGRLDITTDNIDVGICQRCTSKRDPFSERLDE